MRAIIFSGYFVLQQSDNQEIRDVWEISSMTIYAWNELRRKYRFQRLYRKKALKLLYADDINGAACFQLLT